MPRDTLQIGGEGVGPSPRDKPAARKATSPYAPANRNPLTGDIIRFPGYDDDEDNQPSRKPVSSAITPSKPSSKTINLNGAAAALHADNAKSHQTNGQALHTQHDEKNNPVIITSNSSNGYDKTHDIDLKRLQISVDKSVSQRKVDLGDDKAVIQQLYDKYVRKGESGNAAHHRIHLDDRFTNVLKTQLPDLMTELCHNQTDMTMSAYIDDRTCAKLPFVARLVTTRLPHVCDDIVGCLFVRGGRVSHSTGESLRNEHVKSASNQSAASSGLHNSTNTDGMALFFYKPLSGKRAPLLQPFVSCAPLRHVTGWKKGAVIGLSDLYVGAELTIEPREAVKQKQQAEYGRKKAYGYYRDGAEADDQQDKGKMTLSALANELLEADRYMTLKVMWLDDAMQQQCLKNLGKPLAIEWAGSESGSVERIRNVFAVREKIAQQLRNISSWKTVCFDIFGLLVGRCLAALQNTEINTHDEHEHDNNASHAKNGSSAAVAETTVTKPQVLQLFGETSTDGQNTGERLVLNESDVDAIFEQLLPQRVAGGATGDTVNIIHLADFIAFSWTSEHETWLLRKAYRKLDPSCTGVVPYKALESFTCARNATLTTEKGVREISSFTGLGGEVKEMFDDFIAGLKKRSPNGITYYDLACFVNTLAVNDGWKQPENDMDRANLIAWSIKRLFTVDD